MLRISCLALSRNNLRAQLYTKKLRGNWTELNNIFVFLRFNHKTTLTFKNKIEIFSSALNFFIFSFSLSLAVSSFFLLLVVPILCWCSVMRAKRSGLSKPVIGAWKLMAGKTLPDFAIWTCFNNWSRTETRPFHLEKQLGLKWKLFLYHYL